MKKTMYERIYEDIIDAVKSGRYKEKDMLPSEKELAERYHVSRITTGKAMKLLVDQGILMRVRGKGTFVCQEAEQILGCGKEDVSQMEAQRMCTVPDTNAIGVIIDAFDIDYGTYLLKGIEKECHANKMNLFLRCTYGDPEDENEAIKAALECGCKGLILMSVQGEVYNELLLKLALNKTPVVLVDRELKGLGFPCVQTDNAR